MNGDEWKRLDTRLSGVEDVVCEEVKALANKVDGYHAAFLEQPKRCMMEVDDKLRYRNKVVGVVIGLVLTVCLGVPGGLWAISQLINAVARANGG